MTLTYLSIRVYILQAVILTLLKSGYVMDIFQNIFSRYHAATPSFSDIFCSANEIKHSLGTKSYLLDYYISLFFHLSIQIDFNSLADATYDSMSVIHKKFLHAHDMNQSELSKKISILMQTFDCQEPFTEENLCFLSLADCILEQALSEFLSKQYLKYQSSIDVIELQQTADKIAACIGNNHIESFQMLLIQRFMPYSITQFFLQGITIELTKIFLTRDIETDQEAFRLLLKKYFMAEKK